MNKKDFFAHETAVIDRGCEIGRGSRIWHFCHIMPGAVLGENCNLGQNVFVGSGVVLGRNVKVQNNVSIYTGVACGDDVFLGPSVVFTNIINPRSQIVRKGRYTRTSVGRGVTIGANATIICGIAIGDHAFVAAGAVVTRDVQAYSLVMGSPARPAGWMSEYGHRLRFGPDGIAECPESKEKYLLKNNRVEKIQR